MPKVATAALWKSGTEKPEMRIPRMAIVTASADNRCLSGSHDPNREDALEETREEEGLLIGKVWPPVEDGPKKSSMNTSELVAVKD